MVNLRTFHVQSFHPHFIKNIPRVIFPTVISSLAVSPKTYHQQLFHLQTYCQQTFHQHTSHLRLFNLQTLHQLVTSSTNIFTHISSKSYFICRHLICRHFIHISSKDISFCQQSDISSTAISSTTISHFYFFKYSKHSLVCYFANSNSNFKNAKT